MVSVDDRKTALEHWLKAKHIAQIQPMQALAHDASFRRYFRIQTRTGSYLAMDAPPPQENCGPYVAIARALREKGLSTPDIFAEDLDNGFLLISDFGDQTYLKMLNKDNVDSLYGRALQALSVMQGCQTVPDRVIPLFTGEFMLQEWAWHKEWFLGGLLELPLTTVTPAIDECYRQIVDLAVSQPQVFMHRDYHSANLMVLPDDVGVLDFQDAFIGPVTYDLVSLLRDCYIDWPTEKVEQWACSYWQLLTAQGVITVDQATFLRWFDWMGIQRHLKALFTFSRKKIRDNQSQYLAAVPRTFHYLQQVSARYSELTALHEYLHTRVKPAMERVLLLCER